MQMKNVFTEEQALALLFEGESNRAIAEHGLNARSSRSHCIFTVYIEAPRRPPHARLTCSTVPVQGRVQRGGTCGEAAFR